MILTTFRRAKHFYLYILVRLGVYYSGQLARTIRNSGVSLNQYYYLCQPTYAASTVDIAPHSRLILFFNKFLIKFCIIIYLTYILYHNFLKNQNDF